MGARPHRARGVTWNGKDVAPELREVPPGRYVVEAVEEEAPALTPVERGSPNRGGARIVRSGPRRGREARPRDRRSPRALKVTSTDEAVADIVEAITHVNERNPTAAAKLDAEIPRCIERWQMGVRRTSLAPSIGCGAVVRSW